MIKTSIMRINDPLPSAHLLLGIVPATQTHARLDNKPPITNPLIFCLVSLPHFCSYGLSEISRQPFLFLANKPASRFL